MKFRLMSNAAALALGSLVLAASSTGSLSAQDAAAPEAGNALARATNATRGKIINGVPAAPGQLPFQVSLFTPALGHFCGGSLIGDDWVVTAAHCILLEDGETYRVLTGTNDLLQGGEVREAVGVFKHAGYGTDGQAHDIALLKLAPAGTARAANRARPLRLAQGESRADGQALVSGFGTTEYDNISFQLLVADVPLLSNTACNAPSAYNGQIGEGMLCAGDAGKDSCQGDSGGPLVTGTPNNYQLVGVVSWGAGCNQAGKPGVYTRVSAYYDWIMQTMAAN